jgi:hypothetical protein
VNWKVKAFFQNLVACLPKDLSYEAYFQIQRYWPSEGGLKKPFSPMSHFSEAVYVLKKIQMYGDGIIGKKIFEVGTGRAPLLPVAFWLGGADRIITVDLNPYMRLELIEDMLFYIKEKPEEIKKIFGELLMADRFEQLLDYSKSKRADKDEFLKMCRIEYTAPGDAANTHLDENSVHFHISNVVYEHIPLDIISGILAEGNRIITEKGLFINIIDYADHFA